MTAATLVRWQSLQHGGQEQLQLDITEDGVVARSAMVSQSDTAPVGFFYELRLGSDWRFGAFELRATSGQMLTLSCEAGLWLANGAPRPDLEGCIDVDFQATPFTNTLPIRREPLAVGSSRRFLMAYISLDTFEPQVDAQIYTRLAADRYRYEAANGSFAAELTVDAQGLVTDYPPLFVRVAP